MNFTGILKLGKQVLFSIALLAFTGCERITFEEHQVNKDYTGELEWTQLTDKAEWGNRVDHEAVVFNNKIWISGGYNQGARKEDPYYEDVWNSADGISWELVSNDNPWKGRRGHVMISFDDGSGEAMYLIGGYSVDEATGIRQYNNDVWKSTDGITWTEIKATTEEPDLNSSTDWFPRMHHKCVVREESGTSYIYLIAGNGMRKNIDGRYAMRYFNDVWRSTDGVTWEKMNATEFGIRGDHAATIDENGKMYVHGGMHGLIFESENNSTEPIEGWNNIWSSADGINWQRETQDVNERYLNRASHEMVFYKGRVWTLPGRGTSTVHYGFTSASEYGTWTYQDGVGWALDSEGVAIDARHSYAAVVFQDKIIVLGGQTNKNGQDNDVWAGSLN